MLCYAVKSFQNQAHLGLSTLQIEMSWAADICCHMRLFIWWCSRGDVTDYLNAASVWSWWGTHTHPLCLLSRLGQHDHLENIFLKHFKEGCESDSPTWATTHCTLCSSSWTDISSSLSQHSISGRGRSCFPPVFLSLYLYPSSSSSSPRCLLTLPLHTNVPFS